MTATQQNRSILKFELLLNLKFLRLCVVSAWLIVLEMLSAWVSRGIYGWTAAKSLTNWDAGLLGDVPHSDGKSRSGQWSGGDSSWEAFLLQRSCIYFMVYSEREWTVVLLCQGVWQRESSSGTNPQLRWHGVSRKVWENVKQCKPNQGEDQQRI